VKHYRIEAGKSARVVEAEDILAALREGAIIFARELFEDRSIVLRVMPAPPPAPACAYVPDDDVTWW
jgi:hypothetical protein